MTNKKHLNEFKKWAGRVGGTLGAIGLATLAASALSPEASAEAMYAPGAAVDIQGYGGKKVKGGKLSKKSKTALKAAIPLTAAALAAAAAGSSGSASAPSSGAMGGEDYMSMYGLGMSKKQKKALKVGAPIGAALAVSLAASAAGGHPAYTSSTPDPTSVRVDEMFNSQRSLMGSGSKKQKIMSKQEFGEYALKAFLAGATIASLNALFEAIYGNDHDNDLSRGIQFDIESLDSEYHRPHPDFLYANPTWHSGSTSGSMPDVFFDARS